MTVKDLYNTLDKTSNTWDFKVYVDGISNNILAECNNYYDVEGTKNKGTGFFDNPYSVKDLFNHNVVSYKLGYDSISIKIECFEGMKTKEC